MTLEKHDEMSVKRAIEGQMKVKECARAAAEGAYAVEHAKQADNERDEALLRRLMSVHKMLESETKSQADLNMVVDGESVGKMSLRHGKQYDFNLNTDTKE